MSMNLVLRTNAGDILDVFYQTPTTLTRLCVSLPKEQALKEYFYWVDKHCVDDTDEQAVEEAEEHKKFVKGQVLRTDVFLYQI